MKNYKLELRCRECGKELQEGELVNIVQIGIIDVIFCSQECAIKNVITVQPLTHLQIAFKGKRVEIDKTKN